MLRSIEGQLAECGLTFDGLTVATKELRGSEGYEKTIFDTSFFNTQTAITIKQYDSTNETVLIEDEDYILSANTKVNTVYQRIKIVGYTVKPPQYLEVNASWGIFTETPQLIEDAVVNFINDNLQERADGGLGEVKSAETGDSKITYETRGSVSKQVTRNIFDNEEFMSVINLYKDGC